MIPYYFFQNVIKVPFLFALGLSFLVKLALYVLICAGLTGMMTNRGLRHRWTAWIPMLRPYAIGSLSDQAAYFRYGKVYSKRKLLLVLSIARWLLRLALGGILSGLGSALWQSHPYLGSSQELLRLSAKPVTLALALLLPLFCLWIWNFILSLIALSDIYQSCDPENSTLYLLFSLFLPITKPFFLFFLRNSERGMPPRKPENTVC